MLRNVDPGDLKMESIRADAEEELMERRPGRYWSKERRAEEIFFGEGQEPDEDEDDEK